MARSKNLVVSITADNRGLKRGLHEAEGDVGRLERVTRRSSGAIGLAFKSAGGLIAGAAIADQIRDTVKAAQEAEVSQKRMQAQLHALGIGYQAHAKQIDRVIQKTSQLSGLDDEDLQDSFTNIVRATGDVNKALHGTTIAADLARAKHMDLSRAGDLIAKVYNGNVGALKRMGIAIDPVTTAQDKLRESTKHATVEQTRAAKEADKTATAQKALGELQKRVGGQAAAYGKTASGAQDRFRVAVENLRERLGKALLPDLTKVTNKVATFVNQMSDGTGAGGRFADKLKNIADRIKPIVKFFTDHPRLVAGAVAAWATYRLAVAAATAVSRLKMLGMFAGLAPKAAVEGAVAGRAFGGAASTSAGTTFSRRAPGMFAAGRFAGAGRAIGALLGTAIMAEVASKFDGPAWAKILRGLVPFQPSPGGGNIKLGKPVKLPDGTTYFPPAGAPPGSRPKGYTNPSRQSPFRPSTKLGALPSQHRSGNKPRAHTSAVVAHAASAVSGSRAATAHAANAGDTGIVALGRQLQREGYTVGEHPAFGGVAPVHVQGSYHYRGEAIDVNGGPGGEPGSLDALYARLQGRPGIVELLWRVTGHFDHLHVAVVGATNPLSGATANTGGTVAPSAASAASRGPLIARRGATVKSVAPRRMGHTATGEKGFQQTGEGAEPTQGQQDIKRQYQIAVRLQAITDELRTARGGRRAQLLDERARLTTELAAIGRGSGTADIPGADAYLASLDRQAAEAELTPDTADDSAVAGRVLDARRGILDYMKSHGFSDTDIAQAARDVKAAQDAVDQGAPSTQDLVAAIKDLKKSIDEQNANATAVRNVEFGQLAKGLADFISGQITGTGYDPRAMTAGAGALARY